MRPVSSEEAPPGPAPAGGAALAKSYIPSEREPEVAARWEAAAAFRAAPSGGRPYSIFIPPPNVTAALHLGHALNNTLQDILTRVARMRGFNALWMPGTDHAGIATQTVVERRLLQQGKRRTDFSRPDFVAQVQAWKDEYERVILEQLRLMGASCDFSRTRFTMDPVCMAAVREAFLRLFRDGLIVRGLRLVNWDPVSRTALADDEVEMEEVDGHMWYLRYPLEDGGGHVTVATTRPETMFGDTAVAVNPRDPRAAALRGRRVRLPIVGRVIPIVEDDYVVMPAGTPGADAADPKAAFATGFLKVTPAHDPNDWEIGRRHGLAVINTMAPDASLSASHGFTDASPEVKPFLGRPREEVRAAVVAWFKANGLLEEVKPYRHAVGHSYRSHVPVEPYLSEQWYVRVTDDRLAGEALRAMHPSQYQGAQAAPRRPGDGELRFFPARYAQTFQQWHEGLRDWCISRQLWWGHRIPVWQKTSTDPAALAAAQAGASRPGGMGDVASTWASRGAVHRARRRDDGSVEELICLPEALDPMARELEAAGFRQDEDVLDTWFSSALWPLSTLGWPDPGRFGMEGLLDSFNPSNVLSTAREIITLWVSRMVMFNRYFRGGTLPFHHVFIHPVVQDGFGQRMSKSLGNGVDPRDIIHTHGADAMRFVLAQIATDTQDVRLPVDMVDPHSGQTFAPSFFTESAGYKVAEPIQRSPADPAKSMVSPYGAASGRATPTAEMPLARNTSARFDVGRNFATKLWNALRFAAGTLTAPAGADAVRLPDRPLLDRWILARAATAVEAVNRAVDGYRFSEYAEVLYDFFWRDLCDWYLEGVKPTIRQDPAQQQVLLTVLDLTLRLVHPACPFVTESLWPAIRAAGRAGVPGLDLPPSELLCQAGWPAPAASLADAAALSEFTRVQALVNAVRNLRGERQVPPRVKVRLLLPAPALALARAAGGVVEALTGASACEPLPPARPATAVGLPFEGQELFVDGLVDAVDAGAERARLRKLMEERSKAASGYEAKLSNPGYLAKAKPEVVEETRRMLEAARADLAAAERALQSLPA